MTINELANIVGVTSSTISRYETNNREPSIETLKNIATALGISLSELLDSEFGSVSELSLKAEKDIQKSLNQTLEQLEKAQDGLMFDGDPIDDETRELLKMSLENSMRLAKQIAKNKYTPKKYEKDGD